MKSKDLQKLVLSKYEKGDTTAKIFDDLSGSVSLRTIQRWCKMISQHGSIDLSHPPGLRRVVRTKSMIQKVKSRLNRKKKVSLRKLAGELDISKSTVQRILKNDLGYRPYKKRIEPLLTDKDKEKRIKFANWIRHNFRKEKTLRILFSDEKMFDLDLNPLDYSIWDEFVHQMNWDKVQSKQTLIEELKRAVKRIREEVVLESCESWTNRLYRLSNDKGDYLH